MTPVETVYLLGFISVTIIRRYFTAKFKPQKEELKNSSGLDRVLLGLIGISMLLPLVKIWIDILPFANYETGMILQWLGNLIFFAGILTLYRSHADLGSNWNPEVAINEKQKLVQSGIYSKIRHPMYSAHILWGVANCMVFSNWIIGPALLLTSIVFSQQRIGREEKVMFEKFGREYEEYCKTTYRLFPKL